MTTEKLIKTLPIIQNQLDALLDFQVHQASRSSEVVRQGCRSSVVVPDWCWCCRNITVMAGLVIVVKVVLATKVSKLEIIIKVA